MGRLDTLMFMVTVCKEYGWTYQEYMNQPAHFIAAIKEKMVRDQKEQERQAKSMKRGR